LTLAAGTLSVVFILATLLGFASHAPGSLGVFDAARTARSFGVAQQSSHAHKGRRSPIHQGSTKSGNVRRESAEALKGIRRLFVQARDTKRRCCRAQEGLLVLPGAAKTPDHWRSGVLNHGATRCSGKQAFPCEF
jgi:hypothetical protein